ncbi:MAG: SDR family oxidoreductase [Promethearchaeota archaeon]
MNCKKIVITGSTKGLGLAFALKFLELGDKVVISSRNQNLVERIVQILDKKYPEQIFGTVADVTDFKDVKRLADFAISKFREIDIWINNAGMAPTSLKEFHELEPEKIQATVNTNILGTLYGSQVAISQMKDKGGMIYNLEGFGSNGMIRKGMQVYGTTKNSIAYIRKALSHEYKDSNVKICSIQPGMAVTNLILPREPGEKFDKQAYWVFNVISDTTENIANKIVPLIKANIKGNKVLKYSSTLKMMWNFFTSWRFKDRFFDSEGNLKIQKIEDKILQE